MEKITRILNFMGNLNENPTLVHFRDTLAKYPAVILTKLGVSPTALNLSGLAFGIISGYYAALGNFPIAAIMLLLSGLSDVMDGAVARYQKRANDFGIFFDSVCDRYTDTAILIGVAWHFLEYQEKTLGFLALLSIVGSTVTSYSKARAESLSVTGRYIGLMNRPERVIALIIGFSFTDTLSVILWVLAILSNLTAIHRIIFYSAILTKRKTT